MAEAVSPQAEANSEARSTVLIIDDDGTFAIRLGVCYDPSG
jgi:hypothetical protein